MEEAPAKKRGDGVLVDVHVAPKACEDSVSYSDGIVRVRTKEPPDKGKANKAVIKLVGKVFGPCDIVSGLSSRRKTLLVRNVSLEEVCAALRRIGGGGQDGRRI